MTVSDPGKKAAFLIPCAEKGERLELAFQTVNAGHSLQYLSVIGLVLKLRKERGLLDSPFLRRVSGTGGAAWAFYGLCFVFTAALLAGVLALVRVDPIGLAPMRYYCMVILSALFVHYALDGYLFFAAGREGARPDTIPLAAPSM